MNVGKRQVANGKRKPRKKGTVRERKRLGILHVYTDGMSAASAFDECRQEDQVFKVILNCIMNLRPQPGLLENLPQQTNVTLPTK